ncbi:dihydrolipoamide acetyltransferase family protein [Pseudonocardia xinjiangensis]|uniref:dihydrolipoamide acetyltransferase family protein n=1 Tax=Pseudonocardia xinjiangensis TaxID=75289 RepID=UPI001B7D0163|nr:dihydrolipoamide acetyltransferase family protein [Pseudonocardia xinjiangensis]
MGDSDGVLDVRMPRLSESMSEGTIVRWLHASGAAVERGDELAEIETDKATVSFEADAGGVLEILAEEGATLPVGAVIARVGGSPAADTGPPVAAGLVADPPPAAPAPAPSAPAPPVSVDPPAAATAPARRANRVPTSPLARRRAKELGVDLAGVRGTGPGGRIVRADIEAAAAATAAAAAPAAALNGSAPAGGSGPDLRGGVTLVELSRARRLTADRMAESAATVPSFPLTAEVDMTRALELRSGIADLGDATAVPTVTDLVVAASGRALWEHPRVNASYREGTVAMFERVNIGVAVDTPEALLVPTVTDADRRSLTSIAVRTRELAELARSGRIGPADLEGATFTVSNLGMFGVTVFEAVINPPQAAILAVGALRRLPREIDGEVQFRPVLTLTLTSDHRVLDGAESARFLRRLVELLERPLALLLDHPTTSEERA